MKLKLTWRIWVWIIVLFFAIISIVNFPNLFQKGVMIKSVEQNSSAFEQGLRANQIITAIDGKTVTNVDDYSRIIQEKFTSNEKVKITITTTTEEYILYSNSSPEITVSNLEKTNIKTGLDLSGGARALVQAKDHKLTKAEVDDLVNVVSNRLNVYGFSDITIRPVSDLSGNNFMLVEIAGATPKDLENLISQQGKFEAKIGNETVFVGGEKDITDVARGGQDSGVYSCDQDSQGTYFCQFRFVVYLSQAAAEKHASITSNISVNSTAQGNYLSKKLDLYLDDKLVDSLLISENLKGRVTTQIQITGSGSGENQADAAKSAEEDMKNLQTILITGSLPFQLEIVKIDTISPTLGGTFTKYILIAGFLAILSVAIVVFIKYRKWKLVIPPLLICTSEIIIILGVAAFVRQDLDLPGIAGILAAIGTGIDDQIVVLDEVEHKEESLTLKQKIKRAFTIVMGAFFASAVSLLPLLWAGAGLLKGFAIMSLIGITIGVFVTRRAFADIVNMIQG
jgi:preprotein translocase subunit SecD